MKCTFWLDKKTVWVEELLYKTLMTNGDLIEWFKQSGISTKSIIYADASEPARIEELYRAGWQGVKPANKDIAGGIDSIKSTVVHVSDTSINLIKELHHYAWHVDKNNTVLDVPLKINDHAVDALRYAIHTHKKIQTARYLFI